MGLGLVGFRLGKGSWGALAALLLLATPAAAETGPTPEIEYGYPQQPPRAFTNADGELDGHYPRLLRVLLGRAGLSWHAARYPAPRLMQNLQQGETNFSILVKNPLLEECCIFSRAPVWYDELKAYSVGNVPRAKRKEDLVGRKVITLAGFSYGGLITFLNDPENKMTIIAAKTHQAAFAMLEAGRADYLLDYSEVADSEALASHLIANLRQDVVERVEMYFVITRSYPNAQAVLDRLEALYRALYDEDVKGAYTKK